MAYPEGHPLHNMTQAKWQTLGPARRAELRDLSGLTSQLIPWEGWRVEVKALDGDVYRFNVCRSTGWRPIHLEVHNARSAGGTPAADKYEWVRGIRKVS